MIDKLSDNQMLRRAFVEAQNAFRVTGIGDAIVQALLQAIEDNTDGIEPLLTALGLNTDQLETLVGGSNTTLTAILAAIQGLQPNYLFDQNGDILVDQLFNVLFGG